VSDLNPNQFAFKGMAKYAHPLAKALRKGITFKVTARPGATARADMDDPRGPSYRVPLSFDPPVNEYSLLAVAPSPRPRETVEGTPGRLAGELHWRGDKTSPKKYPGEITYVGRGVHATEDIYRTVNGDSWASRHPFPRTPGLMTNMFKFAHQEIQPGQRTVPVHSPERSAEGEAWSAKVGPEHLRPERYDEDWRPPYGVHPYERAGRPPQFAPHVRGQQQLFNTDPYEPDPF
jgi:hypothetical protein